MQLQPDHQGFACGHVQLFGVEAVEGGLEAAEAVEEIQPLLLAPHVIRLQPQRCLQLGILSRLAQPYIVQLAELEEIHELVIGHHPGLIAQRRHHAGHLTADAWALVAFEHADPLVALGDVKLAHVLVADDGIVNAVSQVGFAQVDPLVAELGGGIQQRHEIARKGGFAALGGGAHNLLHGDFH